MSQKELQKISGVGPKFAQTLAAGGVSTLADLAASSPEKLADILAPPAWRVPDYDAWIRQAQALVEPEDGGGTVPAVEPEAAAEIVESVAEITQETPVPVDMPATIETEFEDIEVELEETVNMAETDATEVAAEVEALTDEAEAEVEIEAAAVAADVAAVAEEIDTGGDEVDTDLEVEIEEIVDAAVAEPVAAVAPPTIDISEKPPVTTTSSTVTSPPPPLEVVPVAAKESGGGSFLRDLLLIAIGGLLGAGIALGGLYFLNGTLDFSRHERFQLLDSEVSGIQQEYTGLTERVDAGAAAVEALDTDLGDTFAAVDSLGGQVDEIGGDVALLNDDVLTLSEQDAEFTAEFETVNGQLDALGATADRFDTFTVGLAELAASIVPPALITPASPITPTEEITVTEPISVTEPMTVTEPISVTEPVTVTEPISETEEMTATEEITATEPITGSEEAVPDENNAEIQTEADTDAITPSPALKLFPPLETISLPDAGQSHVFGLVWDDLNGNGVPETDEIPLPAVKIVLKNGDGDEIAAATTDEAGRFLFDNLDPGTYIITETDPDETESITPNTVTVTTTSDGVIEINFADASSTSSP